jgi:hypothetical protein
MHPTKIDQLILDGSLEVSGMLDDGNFTFKFTSKLKEKNPEIYEEVMRFFYSQVMFFWEKGFVSFNISEEDPAISVTEKAFDKEAVSTLTPMQQINLNLIIETMTKKDL